jgi:Tol biopolymer transport system component
MAHPVRWFGWGFSCSLLVLLSACNSTPTASGPAEINSRYNEEQPAISGNGRWLAMVSNRRGTSEIMLYDLQGRRFEGLTGFYAGEAIASSPSLSLTGRYLVYLVTIDGRPAIALYDRITKRSDLLFSGYRRWIQQPHISPDGRYVVFQSARKGQWDIEVLDRGPNIELDILDGTPIPNP